MSHEDAPFNREFQAPRIDMAGLALDVGGWLATIEAHDLNGGFSTTLEILITGHVGVVPERPN